MMTSLNDKIKNISKISAHPLPIQKNCHSWCLFWYFYACIIVKISYFVNTIWLKIFTTNLSAKK